MHDTVTVAARIKKRKRKRFALLAASEGVTVSRLIGRLIERELEREGTHKGGKNASSDD